MDKVCFLRSTLENVEKSSLSNISRYTVFKEYPTFKNTIDYSNHFKNK